MPPEYAWLGAAGTIWEAGTFALEEAGDGLCDAGDDTTDVACVPVSPFRSPEPMSEPATRALRQATKNASAAMWKRLIITVWSIGAYAAEL